MPSLNHPLDPSSLPKSLFDEAEVRRALPLFQTDGSVAEVRALEATTASDRYAGTWFGYFSDVDALVAALRQLKTADGIYITLNPVSDALLARCSNRLTRH